MKAPTDKTNDTIQIIVTRLCDLFNCSNCTQLLPYRKDPMHMSPQVFRAALETVNDWPGIVGIFGGNPCCHPQFPELMAILEEVIPEQRHRGLWSNNLLEHGELVRRVFYPSGRFNLNAHGSREAYLKMDRYLTGKVIRNSDKRPSWHAPILVDWIDLGLTEPEWIRLRENCDINQKWSSAIAERDGKPYVYFCEVAAALDGIRGENHGIPAVAGWWKWKMDAFSGQVTNCCDRGCGVPLRMRGHLDNEDTYDLSQTWATQLTTPRGKIGQQVHDQLDIPCDEVTDYMRHRSKTPV